MELDLAGGLKPSIFTVLEVGLMAIIVILLLKWVATYDFVPAPVRNIALAI
jgi:hypothetical protein